MEIGCKHETNLNSLKKLAKDEHLTVNVVNTENAKLRVIISIQIKAQTSKT